MNLAPDTEPVIRFLYFNSDFTGTEQTGGSVKPKAFRPHTATQETSCFNIQSADRPAMWAHAAANGRPEPILAAAKIKCGDAKTAGLLVIHDTPPQLHVVLRNWPFEGEDPMLLKAKRANIEQRLSSAAQLLSP